MTIAIDFDGTCVTHAYPEIGEDIGAVSVLEKLYQKGHLLILNTMRCDKELFDAINWFESHHIPLYATQKNPTQEKWTSSPKCYAQLYIDDAALGIPLLYYKKKSDRPFVDWLEVEEMLIEKGVL